MNTEKLRTLQISAEEKRRPQGAFWSIILLISAVLLGTVAFVQPWARDKREISGMAPAASDRATNDTAVPAANAIAPTASAPAPPDRVLTVSGYIINRERIEISPRFLGVVKWIGVKKGDVVTNGQVVVQLDDAEYRARMLQAEGQLNAARADVERDRLNYSRITNLISSAVESRQSEDNARLVLAAPFDDAAHRRLLLLIRNAVVDTDLPAARSMGPQLATLCYGYVMTWITS